MKKIFYILVFSIFLFVSLVGKSQQLSNIRTLNVKVLKDTIQIDTLSLIPNSIIIIDTSGKKLDSTLYKVDYPNSKIIFNSKLKTHNLKLKITYRVFPYSFSKVYYKKDPLKIQPDYYGYFNPLSISYENKVDDIFKLGTGLNKNGSISRGVSFGNNQDVIVNSTLNLQLSGKLNDDIDIVAAISDNNIPIQPDGNTQQLQEFDKVFIQLSNKNSKLIAGDFDMKRPNSYFMNFNKKAQGLGFTTISDLSKKESTNPMKLKTTIDGAVAKGKLTRNSFNGLESNQGPYRLKGANNELFVIVLAGTEKVYIDGQLLKRGQDLDYVIDYNTAEITFTPKRLITKDSRIVVEFEYSDKNYGRSTFFIGNEFESKKLKIKFNIFSEQDSKNQPIQQTLTPEKKALLSSIGNDLSKAIYPKVDSIPFNTNEVLYKRIDTIIGSIKYLKVYIYSTNSDSAKYRVGFSYVGDNKGNYIQVTSTANGKVFKWIAPINGILQGSYEPVELIVTPKMQQLYTLGFDYAISKRTKSSFEVALSNYNQNLFSNIDKKADQGFALKYNLENTIPIGNIKENGWNFTDAFNYEFKNMLFQPIEKYRPVEFERDWNITGPTVNNYEHLAGIKLELFNKKNNFFNYNFNTFLKGNSYNGFMNSLNSGLNKNNYFFTFNGSVLNSKGLASSTQYFKQKSSLIKKFKIVSVGIKEELEQDKFFKLKTDSLQKNSFSFIQYETFVQSSDTTANKFLINYKHRIDNSPIGSIFKKNSIADEIGVSISLLKNSKNQIILNTTYRKLTISDTNLTKIKPDNSVLSRIEYNLKLLKNAITSNMLYEIGSGLEVKKEFYYVSVPAGQGVYTWIDYNHDGIPQLNEFEIAAFPDQATHIRVFVPTNQFVKSYSNQFNEVLNLNPYAVYNNTKGFKKLLSRFSNQTIFHVDQKSTTTNLAQAFNPFNNKIADSSLLTLNSSLRNTFYFNRTSSKYGIDLGYQENKGKSLLVNGVDSKSTIIRSIKLRWNIIRELALNSGYSNGDKISKSQYMVSRDYNIGYFENENILSFQPNTSFRTSFNFTYSEKQNQVGLKEWSINRKSGVELRYNLKSKGSLITKFNLINISFSSDNNNSPVAFEMLEGLKAGQNLTWGLSFQQNLSNNLQINLSYDGRKSEGVHIVHTGNVQLRAFF